MTSKTLYQLWLDYDLNDWKSAGFYEEEFLARESGERRVESDMKCNHPNRVRDFKVIEVKEVV